MDENSKLNIGYIIQGIKYVLTRSARDCDDTTAPDFADSSTTNLNSNLKTNTLSDNVPIPTIDNNQILEIGEKTENLPVNILANVQPSNPTILADNGKTVKSNITSETKTNSSTSNSPKRSSKIIQTKLPSSYEYTAVIEALQKISTANTSPTTQLNNAVQQGKHLQLDSETLLVIDLLTMGYSERVNFLHDIAKKCHLIILDKQTKRNIVNPQFLALNRNEYPEVATFIGLRDEIERKTIQTSADQCNQAELTTYKHSSLDIILFNETQKFNQSQDSILTRTNTNDKKESIPIKTTQRLDDIPMVKNVNVDTPLVSNLSNGQIIDEEAEDVTSVHSEEKSLSKNARKKRKKKAKKLDPLPEQCGVEVETGFKTESINKKISRIKAKIQIQLKTVHGANVEIERTSVNSTAVDLLSKPSIEGSETEGKNGNGFFQNDCSNADESTGKVASTGGLVSIASFECNASEAETSQAYVEDYSGTKNTSVPMNEQTKDDEVKFEVANDNGTILDEALAETIKKMTEPLVCEASVKDDDSKGEASKPYIEYSSVNMDSLLLVNQQSTDDENNFEDCDDNDDISNSLERKLEIFFQQKNNELQSAENSGKVNSTEKDVFSEPSIECNENIKQMSNTSTKLDLKLRPDNTDNLADNIDVVSIENNIESHLASKPAKAIVKILNCSTDVIIRKDCRPNQLCFITAKLLTLDDEEQKKYIIKLALEKHILKKTSMLTNVFCWSRHLPHKSIYDPTISKYLPEPKNYGHGPRKIIYTPTISKNLPEPKNSVIGSCRKFNSMINDLAWQNGVAKQMKAMQYDLCEQFDDPINLRHLNKFVEKLVANYYGKIIEGDIRINENDCREAFIHSEGDNDVYIQSIYLRQCAMHGDIVKVFAFNKRTNENTNSQGFVVDIVKRVSSRQVVGRLQPNQKNSEKFCLVTPKSKRLPPIRIEIDESYPKWSRDNNNWHLFKIVKWEGDIPCGTLIETIGKVGTLDAEKKAILAELDICQNIFSDSILNSMPSEEFVIPDSEYKLRAKVSDTCVFTIDPETAKDLDDALSCKKLPNGNYEIGVHISDVSYFVIENSELDNTIKSQATSIYMVDSVHHMLPKTLCKISSLLPGVDKLSCSVYWEMTGTGSIKNTRFEKTIINSCAQLSYAHAQNIIDNLNRSVSIDELPTIYNNFTCKDISKSISILHKIASALRKKRLDNGSLQINMPTIQFDLNQETGRPIGIQTYKIGESNYMIEEFMLLANQTVAKLIYGKYPETSFLRHHKEPDVNMMKNLVEYLKKSDYQLDTSSSKSIAKSMHTIISRSSHPEVTRCALNNLLAKPMARALGNVDSAKALHHYALSIPIYTHFTSPIRRYPDILVHRLFNAAIGSADPPTHEPDALQEMAHHCNSQKHKAKLAGEECSKIFFIDYIKLVKKLMMRAAIFGVAPHYIDCVLISTGHKLRLNINEMTYIDFRFIEPGLAQITSKKAKKYMIVQLFSEINVEVCVKKETLKGNIIILD